MLLECEKKKYNWIEKTSTANNDDVYVYIVLVDFTDKRIYSHAKPLLYPYYNCVINK